MGAVNTYTKERGVFNDFEDSDFTSLFDEDEGESPFHIGQSYEKTAPRKLVCKICGGDGFIVGQGPWFTAIKCLTCEWESCIHEG